MTEEYGDYVYDIVEAMNDIRDFVGGMNFAQFANDKKTVNAVIRSLEVVGEATREYLMNLESSIRMFPGKR